MGKRAVANHTNILVLIGPSGAGKSTVARELIKQGIVSINPSWTTRPVREGEDELEHVFVDDKEFSRRASEGFFLDWAQPFDLPYSYGLPPIEALACGAPVVACDVPGVRDVLQGRATLVDTADLEGLVRAAEAATRPAPDPPAWTWEDAARATWRIYEEAAAR